VGSPQVAGAKLPPSGRRQPPAAGRGAVAEVMGRVAGCFIRAIRTCPPCQHEKRALFIFSARGGTPKGQKFVFFCWFGAAGAGMDRTPYFTAFCGFGGQMERALFFPRQGMPRRGWLVRADLHARFKALGGRVILPEKAPPNTKAARHSGRVFSTIFLQRLGVRTQASR